MLTRILDLLCSFLPQEKPVNEDIEIQPLHNGLFAVVLGGKCMATDLPLWKAEEMADCYAFQKEFSALTIAEPPSRLTMLPNFCRWN